MIMNRILCLVLILVCGCETQSPTSSSTTAQSAPIQIQPTIPGIAAVDVYGNLESKGFSLTKNFGNVQSEWKCEWRNPTSGQMLIAQAFGKSPSIIDSVQCSAGGGVDEEAIEFISYVATVPYDGSNPAMASQWVKANIAKRAGHPTIVIGPCKYELAGNRISAVLMITPFVEAQSPTTVEPPDVQRQESPGELAAHPVEQQPEADPISMVREFSDASGNFKVEAKVTGYKGGWVRLERIDNGKSINVEVKKLSDDDQVWLKSSFGDREFQ